MTHGPDTSCLCNTLDMRNGEVGDADGLDLHEEVRKTITRQEMNRSAPFQSPST